MTNVQPSYSGAGLTVRWTILAAVLFLVGGNGFVIAGVLPDIAADLHVGAAAVGFTITLYALLVAVLAPVVAVAFARMSRTLLMVLGLLVLVVGVLLAAAATDVAVFAAGRALAALGGAALVPTATATAAAIAPPAQRGRAVAVLGLGFTLALAVGAPLGTALAAVAGWRVSMLALAALAAVLVPLLALAVRHVPAAHPLSIAQRLLVLRDGRVVAVLVATLSSTAAFNLVYIFSARVTGTSGAPLALLLLVFGVGGIVGNSVAGPLTDRFGSRGLGAVAMVVQVLALVVVAIAGHAFAGLAAAFLVWGAAAFAAIVPLQHRLLHIDARTAAVAISWYSTALYLGIAVAPVAGAAVLGAGEPVLLPIGAAVLGAAGLVAFLAGHRARRADVVAGTAGLAGATPGAVEG